MRTMFAIARREFLSYFQTTLAVVFLVVFVGAAGALTFDIGGFFARGQADLSVFFGYHSWLFLVLMPAVGMRLWAEERRSGTIEFLMTLPVSAWQAVAGKFLAAWAFAALGLALTFPIWVTVNYLGDPDNGVIVASYAGSLLMAGGFLGVASTISALTKNQITAFVTSVTAGFILMMTSLDPIRALLEGWAPTAMVQLVSTLSFARHFDAITRGVLDMRDVIFFASFITLMLFINVRIIDRSGGVASGAGGEAGRRALSLAAVLSAVALFFAVNALSAAVLGVWRFDLTERRLYTLSDSTRTVLSSIPEPVTLRLYRTPQLVASVPVLQIQDRKVDELLTHLERLSDGMLRVETVEVAPFSDEEDEALSFRLRGFPLGDTGERGYYGLIGTNSLDGLEAIEFLDPSRDHLLQYDLTRMIYRLAQLDEPRVAVIDGLGMYGNRTEGRQPWAILGLMSANFALERVPPAATEIPAGTDVLVMTHPVRPAPDLQYAIDQYVLGGGAALVFVDPLAENSAPSRVNPTVPEEPSSAPESLLSAWGVAMDPGQVVGDRDMALQTVGYAGQQRVVANYLPWLRVNGSAFNAEDLITAQLEIMRMSSAGAITHREGAGTTLTPLIRSTGNSMLLDQLTVMSRVDPNTLLSAFEPSGERHVLAARIRGEASTAFPDGAPGGAPAATTGQPPRTRGDVNIVLVADTDLLADSHVVGEGGRLASSNADFVLNAIETLAGGEVLAGVRSSGLSYRPFTTVQEMQARAEGTYRATEQRLAEELEQVQARLQQVDPPGADIAGDPLAATREQQQTIAEYNQRAMALRAQLRDVRAALRADIENLETRLRLANIFLVPLFLILLTAVAAGLRRLRFSAHLRRLAAR